MGEYNDWFKNPAFRNEYVHIDSAFIKIKAVMDGISMHIKILKKSEYEKLLAVEMYQN